MNNKAFTLVEIMIVITILVLIIGISSINLLASRRAVEYNLCIESRRVIEHAEIAYFAHTKTHSNSFGDLVSADYLAVIPDCPTDGVFAWAPYERTSPYYQSTLGCSFHAIEQEQEEQAKFKKEKKPKK